MSRQTVTSSEYEIMKILWREGAPMSLGEILKNLSEREWSRNTVGTMLTRLCEKGVVAYEKKGKANLYYAVLEEKDYSISETKSFLSRLYDGSVWSMLAALYENKEFSEEDIAELKKLIDEKTK